MFGFVSTRSEHWILELENLIGAGDGDFLLCLCVDLIQCAILEWAIDGEAASKIYKDDDLGRLMKPVFLLKHRDSYTWSQNNLHCHDGHFDL